MDRVIRVWLEPEYDHGRTGAWMLDWPGAFTWGETREAALARVPSAVHRFADWLAEHAETAAEPSLFAKVVEEVAARRLDDGYEVNATFEADRRPVVTAELERQLRLLAHARDDLRSLVDRLRPFEAAGGRLPVEQRTEEARASGAAEGRTSDEVLRHVAGAEAWFASRLDPAARYSGPPRDGDVDVYLDATRDFCVATLRMVHAADPAASRADGKGEEWTLAKLLRRALYHSLDHLEELDRGLALAERRVERLDIRHDASVDIVELLRLFAAAGLGGRVRDGAELTSRAVIGATETVSAWDDGRLVGFGRIISDEATNGYISTVAVAPRWQDRGLGTRLMRALMDGREALKLTLDAREGVEPFYERLGFGRVETVLVRPRGKPAG